MAYIGSFGGCIFQVSPQQILTFSKMQRKTKAIFSEHKILGSTSKLEFTGVEPVEFQFEIQMLQSLGVNPETELKMLREVCQKGLADYLIIGGENLGLYVLETIDEEVLHTNASGVTIAANVKISLKEYNFVGDY